MDAAELERVLSAKLMAEAAQGIAAAAVDLAALYDAWVAQGESAEATAWLGRLLERLGWWAGRLDQAAEPELVAGFPSLD